MSLEVKCGGVAQTVPAEAMGGNGGGTFHPTAPPWRATASGESGGAERRLACSVASSLRVDDHLADQGKAVNSRLVILNLVQTTQAHP